jgi:hypothetical protein
MAMDWVQAFARQACSDFDARDKILLEPSLPQCHQLHYLQMAMEKTSKAHLLSAGAEPYSVQSSHGYIASVVPTIVRDRLGRTGAKPGWLMDAVRLYARRVELLHPQIDSAGAIPANCEYPWEGPSGDVIVPAEHDFALNIHAEKAAVTMIKEVRARAIELAR